MSAEPPIGPDVSQVRIDKTRVLAQVSQLAVQHDIRLLAAGGPIYAEQGLISPSVSRSAAVVVDVTAIERFLPLLYAEGWTLIPPVKRFAVMPSVVLALDHPQWSVDLAIYTAFPGFYTDPQRVFAILWTRRKIMTLYGTSVPILDRLSTVVMASHDRLGPHSWDPKARSYEAYLTEQFKRVLTAHERKELLRLVRDLVALEPMRPLLDELGLDPGPIILPNEDYAKWRLALNRVTPATLMMLALAECPAPRRLKQSLRVLQESPRVIVAAVVGAPKAWWLILTTRRRMRAEHRRLAESGH